MSNNFEDIKQEAREEHIPIMMDDGMRFLLDFIDKHEEVKEILEIGTAVGLSSMRMASVREDIHVDTLEIDENLYTQALTNIEDNNLSERIDVYLADGLDYKTDKVYDLIFVDAAKSQYRNYLEHFYDNSHKGTYFVFDNLNFHGIVDNPELSHNRSTLQMTRKIKKFRNWLLVEPRFSTEFYKDIGDGVAIARRIR